MIFLSYVTADVSYAIRKTGLPNTFKKAEAATRLSLRMEKVVLILAE